MSDTAEMLWQKYLDGIQEAYDKSDYDEVERLSLAALHELEGFGAHDPHVASAFKDTIHFYTDEGANRVKLEQLCRRWLALQEAVLGPSHLDLVPTLTELAGAIDDPVGDAEAEHLCQRALAITEQAYGPESAEAADKVRYLAQYYRNHDRHVEAEPLWLRAIALRERAFEESAAEPESHRHIMNRHYLRGALFDLVMTYNAQLNYPDAEAIQRRILSLLDEEQEEERAFLLVGQLQMLATICSHQGKFDEAEFFLKCALTIHEQQPLVEHDDLNESARNTMRGIHTYKHILLLHDYAGVLCKLNRESDAELFYKRAITLLDEPSPEEIGKGMNPQFMENFTLIRQQTLAAVLGEYAILCSSLHRTAEAELLYRRTLSLHDEFGGQRTPVTLRAYTTVLREFAALLRATDREAEAAEMETRATSVQAELERRERAIAARKTRRHPGGAGQEMDPS